MPNIAAPSKPKHLKALALTVAAMATICLPPLAHAACQNTQSFSSWLSGYKKQAAAEGISRRTIQRALGGIQLSRKVIRRDRRQGFFAQGFDTFSKKLATNYRMNAGRKQIKKYRRFFDRAQSEFGVPPEVITAFWALESDFGAGMGKFSVLTALATLAYDCRRKELFTGELTAALKIIDKGDLNPEDMIGSWAGELGQVQFLPRHYLEHAIDYDGNGRANLFTNNGDIIGTTAAFIKHLGWKAGEPWLHEVRVPRQLPWDQAELDIKHPRSQWAAWGVRRADGSPLPADSQPASLLLPMGRFGPAFLAYPNFDIYTQWNNSLNYSTTAAYLATRIAGAASMKGRDRKFPRLDVKQIKQMQRTLTRRGFDVGKADGIVGAKTRAAVRAMQKKYGLPADGFPTPSLLNKLRAS
ncbi:MAG: lytic murein transglycosylase [Pseudomonadota bacterium]